MNLIVSFCLMVGVLLGSTAAVSITDAYKENLDRYIKWDQIKENYKQMRKGAYTSELAEKVRDIERDVEITAYHYYNATESIFKWCSKCVQIASTTEYLFDRFPDIVEHHKQSMKKEIENGISKMDASIVQLTEGLEQFYPVLRKVLDVKRGIHRDYYYVLPTALLQMANARIDLQEERYSIGGMIVKAEQLIKLTRMITAKDLFLAGVGNMIDQCKDFRERHSS